MSLVTDVPIVDLRNGPGAVQPDTNNTKEETGPKEATIPDEEAGNDKGGNTSPDSKKKTFIDVIREENENNAKPLSLLPEFTSCPIRLVRQKAVHRVTSGFSDSSDEHTGFTTRRPRNLKRTTKVRYMTNLPRATEPSGFDLPLLQADKEDKTCEFLLKPLLFGWRGVDMIADSIVVCLVVFAWPAWVALLMITFFRLPKINEAMKELSKS